MNQQPNILFVKFQVGAIHELPLLEAMQANILQSSEDEVLSHIAQNIGDLLLISIDNISDPLFCFIEEVKEQNQQLPIILFINKVTIAESVKLIKAGVSDILLAQLDLKELAPKLQNYLNEYQLKKKYFNKAAKTLLHDCYGMVGTSKVMRQLFQMLEQIAKSKATVLILGESGVGKELVAHAIHQSALAQGKFVDLNCGAIPNELLENELFGHERGAYTGAERRYIGSFERAKGGTLFLDEICEMNISLQVKMLRVLQEKHFYRVGGNEKIAVDVRILAATNRDIEKEVREGRFREDLYYRLNVIPIQVPALRERKEDIPMLVDYFMRHYASKNEKGMLEVHPEAMYALQHYAWPGNVRELENTIQRLVTLVQDQQLKPKHLPDYMLQQTHLQPQLDQLFANRSQDLQLGSLEDLEKQAIATTLQQLSGNLALAAKCLKIGQATLYRKIKKYGLSR